MVRPVLDIPSAPIRPTAPGMTLFQNSQPSSASIAPIASRAVSSRMVSDAEVDQIGEQDQQQMATLSRQLMSHVKSSDVDELAGKLNSLIVTAKGMDPSKLAKKGIFGKIANIFGNAKQKMLAEFETLDKRMDTLIAEIDQTIKHHSQRIIDLQKMFDANTNVCKNLMTTISSSTAKLAEFDQAIAEFEASSVGDMAAAQQLLKMRDTRDRMEKKIDDLQRTTLLAQQFGPQLILMQTNARALVDKFNDAKKTTIPAWMDAFAAYILSEEQRKSAEFAKNLDDSTNEAFKKQADLLRLNTQQIATAKNRSIIDTDTLQHVQTQLLGSFDDMQRIAKEAKAARAAAVPQLAAMERELIEKFTSSSFNK